MSARESFLSFARGAFDTKTAHDYSDKTTPVARADAVYQYLKPAAHYPPGMPDPPSPLSPIWHLLSWCVVALEEHLASPQQPRPPTDEEINIVGRRVYQWLHYESGTPVQRAIIAAAISELDEMRAKA
jgi:hypothetical protein